MDARHLLEFTLNQRCVGLIVDFRFLFFLDCVSY